MPVINFLTVSVHDSFGMRCVLTLFLTLHWIGTHSCSVRGIKPDDLASLKEKLDQEVCKYSALQVLVSMSYRYNFQQCATIEADCFLK